MKLLVILTALLVEDSLLTLKNRKDMDSMELVISINQLEAMKNYLIESARLMEQHVKDLQNALESYKAQGFPPDIADNYERAHLDQTRCTVEAIANRINTLHCNYIDGVIDDLKRALGR